MGRKFIDALNSGTEFIFNDSVDEFDLNGRFTAKLIVEDQIIYIKTKAFKDELCDALLKLWNVGLLSIYFRKSEMLDEDGSVDFYVGDFKFHTSAFSATTVETDEDDVVKEGVVKEDELLVLVREMRLELASLRGTLDQILVNQEQMQRRSEARMRTKHG